MATIDMGTEGMALKGGPLAGVRVVELAGIGPGPMCGMLLADMGAQVLLVERLEPANIGIARPRRFELPHRGKQSLAVDLKQADGVALVSDLAAAADVLIEGFRPGTMERLGLGPQACMARHPGLVYGRMTGYGQDGPLHELAGHDLNYLALSGALHALGPADGKPAAPLNLLADYAGGALNLAFGIACALVERNRSGLGQVIDASMVEGAAVLMTSMFGMYAAGLHAAPRGHNLPPSNPSSAPSSPNAPGCRPKRWRGWTIPPPGRRAAPCWRNSSPPARGANGASCWRTATPA